MWQSNGKNIEDLYGLEKTGKKEKIKEKEEKYVLELRKDIYDILLCNEKCNK